MEKHLGHMFESNLSEFLSLPIPQRLDRAIERFRFHQPELASLFQKYSAFISEDLNELGSKSETEKTEYLRGIDEQLKAYLNRELQHIFYSLPYFLWAFHLIFDRTYSQLSFEAKEELRVSTNLNTPKKRKDFALDLFSKFIDEDVVSGGKQSYWDEWTRLLYLSFTKSS